MVDHLTGRAWILHEVGEDVFEFTHRTFMEFFYAKHLETEFESTQNLVEECLKHIILGSRTVSAHLALQIRTKDKRGASSKVCESLDHALKMNAENSELIEFCVDALGYLLPDADSISALVSTLSPRALELKRSTAQVKLLCTVNPLRNAILQSILPSIGKVSTVDAIQNLAPALSKLYRDNSDLVELADGSVTSIIDLIFDQTYSSQGKSPYLCKLAFDLDANLNWKAIEKFGFRIWSNSRYYDSSMIFSDSQKMVKEASEFVADKNYIGNRYLRLAQILSRQFESNDKVMYSEIIAIRYVRHGRPYPVIEINVDPLTWRKNSLALETYAFSLTLFLEVSFDIISKDESESYRDVLYKLANALEETGSAMSGWLKSWFAGKTTIVVDPHYFNRRNQALM